MSDDPVRKPGLRTKSALVALALGSGIGAMLLMLPTPSEAQPAKYGDVTCYWEMDNNNQWIIGGPGPNDDGFMVKLVQGPGGAFTGTAFSPIHHQDASGGDTIVGEETGRIAGAVIYGNFLQFTISWDKGGVDEYQAGITDRNGAVHGGRKIARPDLWANKSSGWRFANNAHCVPPVLTTDKKVLGSVLRKTPGPKFTSKMKAVTP